MARSLSLWLALLMVAPIPLAALPTAGASHADTSGTERSFFILNPNLPIKVWVNSTDLEFNPASGFTYSASGPNPYTTTEQDTDLTTGGRPTIPVIGSLLDIEVPMNANTGYLCGGGGTDSTHITGSETSYEITVTAPGLIAGTVSSNAADGTLQSDAGSVDIQNIPVIPASDQDPSGHTRLVDITIHARVWCSTVGRAPPAGAPNSAPDKENIITLTNVKVDNTPPSFAQNPTVTFGAIAGANGIAKIGDGFTYDVRLADTDFCSNANARAAYAFTFVGQPAVFTPTDYFSTKSLDIGGGFTTTGCPPTRGTVAGTVTAHGTGTTDPGYDYDVASNSGRIVRSESEQITAVPLTPQARVRDEYFNWGVASLDADPVAAGVQPVKIDAVVPLTLTGLDAATEPGAKARVKVPVSRLSIDTVAFAVEQCTVTNAATGAPCRSTDSGTWTPIDFDPVASGVNPQPRSGTTALTEGGISYVTFLTPALAAGNVEQNVTLRAKAIDDAGNEAGVTYLLAGTQTKVLALNPTTPSILASSLRRPVGTTCASGPVVSEGENHAFDVFCFEVTDNLMTKPSTTQPSKTPVYARLWREARSGGVRTADEYFTPQGTWTTTPTDLEVRLVDATDVACPQGVGGTCMSRGKFKLDLSGIPCVNAASTCIPTGSYRLNFFAKDFDNNAASMFPTCSGTQCDVGIQLARDIKDPSYVFGASKDYKNGNFNVIRPLPDAPGGALDLTAVQQGQFLPVSLKVLDEGSGFKNITFRFMTGSGFDRVAESTFGGHAIACMGIFPETLAGGDTEVHALARIPDAASDCDIVDGPSAYLSTGTTPPFIVCDRTASPPRCEYETTHCYGSNPTTSCSLDRTPYVNVSTDGVPFGTYKLQVSTTDWAQRTKTLTLSEVFTVVPRMVIEPGSGLKKDGKISLVVYAGHSDDANNVGGATVACPTFVHTPNTIPSKSGVCEPTSVTIDYLPPGQTATEANYRNLKTFNAAIDKKVYIADLGKQVNQSYGRRETAVGFYRFELKNFTPPSDVQLPEPPVLRVSVRAANTVGGVEGPLSLVRTTVTLSSTDLVSDLVPKKPFSDWSATREPTFYRAPGSKNAWLDTRGADITFETNFNPPGILPKDTAIWYKIYDQGLNFTKEVAAPGTTLLFDDGTDGDSAPRLRDGFHYVRVSAVKGTGAARTEGPMSAAVIVNVGRGTIEPPATGEARPAGAPVVQVADTTVASGGAAEIAWSTVQDATGYRVYVGRDNSPTYTQTSHVPKTFSCDLARPSNGDRPCRLVYWADARSDTYDSKGVATGRNWIARVDIGFGDRIEDVNNPGDPDHSNAPATAHPAHGPGVTTATAYEVNLTRGLYVMEVTAHTKAGTTVNPTDVAYLARTFRVETRAPTIALARSTTATIDNREWTAGAPSFEVTYDVGHFTKTGTSNVSVGIQLVESSGQSWVRAPTRVRQINLQPMTVDAATTSADANIALTGRGPIDGVTLADNARVLVKDHDDARKNGVWTVPVGGGAWTRPAGARTLSDLEPGFLVTVEKGNTQGRSGWMLATSTPPETGPVTVDTVARTFTRYTTGTDGVNLQRYNMTVDLAGYTHGTAFRVLLNLTAENRTVAPPSYPNVRTPRVLTLDLIGPAAKFDLEHSVVNGDDDDLVDGDVNFHGTVDDGIGSGVAYAQFAVREVDSGKFYDGSSFKATLEGQPTWLTVGQLSPGETASQRIWSYVDAALEGDVEDEPENYVLYVRGIDKLGNRGVAQNATALVDGRPPFMGANSTISPTGSELAYTARRFSIHASDRGETTTKALAVNLHLLPPSGRLLTFPMRASSSEADCGFLVPRPSPLACFTVELEDELGWVGDVEYYFSATDTSGNAFCSYGPCDSVASTRPAFPSFHLEDNGPPEIESVKFDPAIPAAGGSVTAVAVIREAAGFLEGYPKAYFYRNGVEVANAQMHPLSAEAVDPSSGAGTWALSTLEAGFDDLRENQTLRVMIVARDANDLAGDPRATSAVVSANVPPILTVLSPALGTGNATTYVGKTATVTARVDDVNLDPRGFTASYAIEGGAAITDTLAANFTGVRPLVTLGKTLGWEFTWKGGDFPDGANVTITLGARDNLSARNTTTFSAVVDAAPPTVGGSVEPKAANDAGTTYVGPLSKVTLDATDGVTPKDRIRIEYSVNGASVSTYTGPVPVTGGDTFRMTYAAVDLAGNRANGSEISFPIDKTPPTVAVVASGANTTITATDELVGVDDARVRLFYKTSSTATQFAEFPFDHATGNTYTATLGSVVGTFIYYVEAADKLGNVGRATVNGVTCSAETPCGLADTGTAPPVITFVSPPEGQTVSAPTEVKWTAFAATTDPLVKLEVTNSAERILVKDGLALEGTTTFDPAALGLAAGDWVLVLTIDDRVNTPVTASRNVEVAGAPPDVIGTPTTPPPTGTLEPGQAYTTRIPVNDTSVTKVKATVVRGNTVVRTLEFDVVDGAIDFRFSESTAGAYQVRLQPVYADGTTGPTETFPGVFRVASAGPIDEGPDGHVLQLSAIAVMGALVVALAAVGAFKRWK